VTRLGGNVTMASETQPISVQAELPAQPGTSTARATSSAPQPYERGRTLGMGPSIAWPRQGGA
jgi:hypothetical protein